MEQRNIVLVSGSGVYGAVSKYITEFAAAFRELGYHTVILLNIIMEVMPTLRICVPI